MAFCIQCGTDLLVDEARFCPLCGTPQPDLSQRGGPGRPSSGPAAGPAEPPVEEPPAAQSPATPPALAAGAQAGVDDDDIFAGAGSPVPAAATAGARTRAKVGPGGTQIFRPVRQAAGRRAGGPRSGGDEAYLWRLGRGDIVAALGSLAVLVSLFVTWFDGTVRAEVPGKGLSVADRLTTDAMGAGGWHWIILLLAVAVFVYVALRTLPGDGVTLPVPHWQLLAVATGTNLALVVLAVLVPRDIGSWSPSYGAVIGLIGALAAFAGALVRGREPEVITAPARQARPEPRPARDKRRRHTNVTRVARATDLAPTGTGARVGRATGAAAAPTSPSIPTAAARAVTTGPPAPTESRSAAPPRPAVSPPEGSAPAPAAGQSPALGPETPQADELMCGICSTLNAPTAKVCRTCGVVLASRGRG